MSEGGFVRPEQLADDLELRKTNYQACFESDAGQYVLADLYHLCHQGRSTWTGVGVEQALINEGKRQVMLHIVSLLTMTDMDIHQLGLRHTKERYR